MFRKKKSGKKAVAAVLAAVMVTAMHTAPVPAVTGDTVAADGTYSAASRVEVYAKNGGYTGQEYDIKVKLTVADGIFTAIETDWIQGSSYEANGDYVRMAGAGLKGILINKPATEETVEMFTEDDTSFDATTRATYSGRGAKAAALEAIQAAPAQGEVTPNPEDTPTATPTPTPSVTVGKAAISKVSSTSYNKLKITWKKVSNATGYIVYRASSQNGSYKKVKTIGSGSTLSYTDAGLTAGKAYYYKVQAIRKSGGNTINGTLSSAKAGKPVPTMTTVRVKAGKKKATVKWKKVSGASGYIVYRANSKNGKYKAVGTIKKGSTVTFVNKKLKSNRNYFYKVRAYRTVNGKKVWSLYSKVQKVKVK